MTLDTQMTLALLQELLMALGANDAYWYKSWLALGTEELGREVAGEVESDWMVPLLVETDRERHIAMPLGQASSHSRLGQPMRTGGHKDAVLVVRPSSFHEGVAMEW